MNSTLRPSVRQRVAAASVRAFHAYAGWLVSISWKRFILLSVLLMIAAGILSELPPFNWKLSQHVEVDNRRESSKPSKADTKIGSADGYDITVNGSNVSITPRPSSAASAVPAVPAAPSAPAAPAAPASIAEPSVSVHLPPGANSEAIKEAVEEARQSIKEAIAEARSAREEALAEAESARAEAQAEAQQARQEAANARRTRIVSVRIGDYLPQMALLFILASTIVKINYKGRVQAEAKAAQATETAESELLKRQVIEARMAAMQAQIEPHFLFNTLASIDHLIEVDPARASVMQKNLIALLRASMPTMRETAAKGKGHLGRELAVVRPYLEILKVRMEERLQTEIDIPDGLLSAEFPPMMIQGLVENAIKHGLEPKPEGGKLVVKAEIVHGDLAVSVTDTGLGFGKAATAGTGVGLDNIRERLQLLYGQRAKLQVAGHSPSGTRVTITVPYTAQRDASL